MISTKFAIQRFFHDGDLNKFELPAPPGAASPVGPQKLGPQIEEMVRAASVMLGGPAAGELAAILRASYAADESYSSAFGKLFARLFAPHGLIILDPLDPGLHRLAEPVLRQAAEDRVVLNDALLARNKELDRAGFAAQVKVTGRSTALFYLGNGGREAIRSNGSQFHADSTSWSAQELASAISASPESFSPNALLRPVMQDYLLPTIAYIVARPKFLTSRNLKFSIPNSSIDNPYSSLAQASPWWTAKRNDCLSSTA